MRYLIFDVSNILHKTFYAHTTEDDITIGGIAAHSALLTINKYFNLYKPDKIIMAFDRYSWRHDYTASDKCISGLKYKGERRKNQTPKQEEKYKLFKQHVDDFEDLIDKHTKIINLAADGLEADDIISGCVQTLTLEEENEVLIVSADKDFMQLLRYDNVHLIDPATGDERDLSEYNNDADYFMFIKCFRGEGAGGDNVQSAYPRVRIKKLEEAWRDEFARQTIMEHKWEHPISGKKFVVKDLHKENRLLMDLEAQPEDIEELIFDTVTDGLARKKKFDFFEFLKFCGKFDLKKVQEGSDHYIDMLSL